MFLEQRPRGLEPSTCLAAAGPLCSFHTLESGTEQGAFFELPPPFN